MSEEEFKVGDEVITVVGKITKVGRGYYGSFYEVSDPLNTANGGEPYGGPKVKVARDSLGRVRVPSLVE